MIKIVVSLCQWHRPKTPLPEEARRIRDVEQARRIARARCTADACRDSLAIGKRALGIVAGSATDRAVAAQCRIIEEPATQLDAHRRRRLGERQSWKAQQRVAVRSSRLRWRRATHCPRQRGGQQRGSIPESSHVGPPSTLADQRGELSYCFAPRLLFLRGRLNATATLGKA